MSTGKSMFCGLARIVMLTTGLLLVESLAAAELSTSQMAAMRKQLEAAAKQISTAMRQQSIAEKAANSSGFGRGRWYDADHIAVSSGGGQGCGHLSAGVLETLASGAATKSVPAALIRAVIAEESAGQPCAVSIKGALGLMQLMPGTAQDLGITDPFDAEQNVRGGTRFLDNLLARYGGDLNLALAAYNAGPVRVDAHREVPPIAETQRYVRRVLDRLRPDTSE